MISNDRMTLSVADCVRLTGLSRATIYQFISSGDLPSLKIDRRRLIRPEALAEWLKRHESKGRYLDGHYAGQQYALDRAEERRREEAKRRLKEDMTQARKSRKH